MFERRMCPPVLRKSRIGKADFVNNFYLSGVALEEGRLRYNYAQNLLSFQIDWSCMGTIHQSVCYFLWSF
jgi:hypothetical protein